MKVKGHKYFLCPLIFIKIWQLYVKFISLKDNVYRYFISRADVETLELVFDDYNEKLKK